jgi:hypothetical protein
MIFTFFIYRMVDCPHDLGFPDPNISVHDGVEEENLTEHDEDDDASQAEDSQPHNRAFPFCFYVFVFLVCCN